MKKDDIVIDGRGFYTIQGLTRRGLQFMRRVQGEDHGTAYSDDSTLTLNIADGALSEGLRVRVNGLVYR